MLPAFQFPMETSNMALRSSDSVPEIIKCNPQFLPPNFYFLWANFRHLKCIYPNSSMLKPFSISINSQKYFLLFFYFVLEYNRLTMLWAAEWLSHPCSCVLSPPDPPPVQAATWHWAEFPLQYSWNFLAIHFKHSSVYMVILYGELIFFLKGCWNFPANSSTPGIF